MNLASADGLAALVAVPLSLAAQTSVHCAGCSSRNQPDSKQQRTAPFSRWILTHSSPLLAGCTLWRECIVVMFTDHHV